MRDVVDKFAWKQYHPTCTFDILLVVISAFVVWSVFLPVRNVPTFELVEPVLTETKFICTSGLAKNTFEAAVAENPPVVVFI
jgi:hypothetical protein